MVIYIKYKFHEIPFIGYMAENRKTDGRKHWMDNAKPIWLHSTIRFSIDDNVNILTPCLETVHTKFTKQASFLNIILAS